jgi:hypothetical protein
MNVVMTGSGRFVELQATVKTFFHDQQLPFARARGRRHRGLDVVQKSLDQE